MQSSFSCLFLYRCFNLNEFVLNWRIVCDFEENEFLGGKKELETSNPTNRNCQGKALFFSWLNSSTSPAFSF